MWFHFKRYCLVLAFVFTYYVGCNRDETSKLDEFIEDVMKCRRIPGMQVAVVQDGKVLHMKGYGYRDVTEKLPVDTDTIFCIGSITKSFTATVVATQLNE